MHNIAFAAKEIDVRICLAEKLHRPPFPTDPPLNFQVQLFRKKGCGMLTLPTLEVGKTFLSTYGHTSINVKGRMIKFRLSDRPVNEGRVRHIRSIPWEDPQVLETRNRQKAEDSQPIQLQGYSFGHFCRDGSFLVDSDTLGNGNIACDLDARKIRLTVQRGTSNMPTAVDPPSSESDLSSLVMGFFFTDMTFTSTKTTSYTPSQIKAVIASDPSQTPCLVILDSGTPPIFDSQFDLPNVFAALDDNQSSHRIPSLHDDRQMPPSCLQLTFSSHVEILTFLERCRRLGLTSVQKMESVPYKYRISAQWLSWTVSFSQ